jgi:PAS domain S-box-containing protein
MLTFEPGSSQGVDAEVASLRRRLAEAEAELERLRAGPAGAHVEGAKLSEAEHVRLALGASLSVVFEWDVQRDRVRRITSTEASLPPTEAGSETLEDVVARVHPADRELFRAQVHAALASEDGVYVSEFRVVRPDGELGWLSERGRIERDAAARPVRLIGISRDVTEQKRREAALAARTAELGVLLASAPVGVGVLDREHRLRRLNQVLLAITGLPEERARGLRFEELVPGLEPGVAAIIEGVFEQGVTVSNVELAGELPHEPGVRRHWLAGFYPLHDDGCRVGSVGCWLIEITAQKRAEEHRRQGEERLQLALEGGQLGFWDLHLPSGHLTYGGSWASMLGYDDDELEPHVRTWERLVHPDDRPMVQRLFDEHVAGRSERYEAEHRLRHKDGSWRWVLSRGKVMSRDAEGRPQRALGTHLDVTGRRQADEALREADRKKDQFIAILAHELRNPLAPVRNAVELLARLPGLDPRVERVRVVLDRQVSHMARLIDDLLDVSRISRGRLEMKKERCDLGVIVRHTADDYRASFDRAAVQLTVTSAPGPTWVEGDPVRLAQMTGNLLNNAVRFTPSGGHVEVRVERDERLGEARVRVSDDGEGIPAALLEHLFDPFSQEEQGLARTKGGLGLGLALTRGLIRLHGGQVEAFSAGEGRGASFSLRLPLQAAPASTGSPATLVGSPASSLRILVVEDNRDSAETLGMLLGLLGHEVRLAHDGAAALLEARTFRPRVVLSDIGLPGALDGYALARALSADASLAPMTLFALSGYANAEARQASRQAGFAAHFAKPPDLAALTGALAEVPRS